MSKKNVKQLKHKNRNLQKQKQSEIEKQGTDPFLYSCEHWLRRNEQFLGIQLLPGPVEPKYFKIQQLDNLVKNHIARWQWIS